MCQRGYAVAPVRRFHEAKYNDLIVLKKKLKFNCVQLPLFSLKKKNPPSFFFGGKGEKWVGEKSSKFSCPKKKRVQSIPPLLPQPPTSLHEMGGQGGGGGRGGRGGGGGGGGGGRGGRDSVGHRGLRIRRTPLLPDQILQQNMLEWQQNWPRLTAKYARSTRFIIIIFFKVTFCMASSRNVPTSPSPNAVRPTRTANILVLSSVLFVCCCCCFLLGGWVGGWVSGLGR